MPNDCLSFLGDDFRFPARPSNRAGLARIAYRIGAFPEFRELLMRRIDEAVELRAWTHREPDDPGIALLEGAAIVGDILTFYQEHYANEAFLRTASWRESIDRLTRLIGYRLAPGIGGPTTFAFEVKGTRPVTIPQGFPVKAELQGAEKAGNFRMDAEITAWPHLSAFNLYRARHYTSYVPANADTVEIHTAGGDDSHAAIAALELKAGDKIMLIPAEPAWTAGGTSFSANQKSPQVVEVKAVETALGRTRVTFETPIAQSWSTPVRAFRLGRNFRHFGQAAPATYVQNKLDASGTITGARERTTQFVRHVRAGHECANTSMSIGLPGELIPLDGQVNGLAVGGRVIVEARIRNGSGGGYKPLTVLKTIASLRVTTVGFGVLNGPATLLGMDSALVHHSSLPSTEADVREYMIHEVTSAEIGFRRLAWHSGGGFWNGADALWFYGRAEEAQCLAGRRLWLKRESDGEGLPLTCIDEPADFSLPAGAADDPRMWPLSFDVAPKPFKRSDFDEDEPTVTVYGNLADASEGKAEDETALGNGDPRQSFQTFKIPTVPLTYHLSAGATPPQAPELEVRVDGRLWNRVDSFFGRGPDEEIYIVREGADGSSYIQFGDGETGARLPSGIKNVSAAYRSGSGANGPIKPGKTPSAGDRLEGLGKLQLPGLVAGGGPPEDGENARDAAPGKIQSLGRLVSLRDYETELLTIPGIVRAVAGWGLDAGVPTLMLKVLLESGREAEFDAVADTIGAYQRCRGPDRFALQVQQAFPRYAWLSLLYAFDQRRRKEDVEAGIRAALGLDGVAETERSGLFGLRRRRLGEKEYATRIEGTVQAVPGVVWCKVAGLGLFAASALDPMALALPAAPLPSPAQVTPTGLQLLRLHPAHLVLTTAPAPPAEECA